MAKTYTAELIAWTKGDSNTPLFFPISGWEDTTGVGDIRPTPTCSNNSGDCQIKPGYRTCNDPKDPTDYQTPTNLGSTERPADGTDFTGTFVTPSFSTFRYYQLGVLAQNYTASSTVTEMCLAKVVFQVKIVG